MPVLIARQDNAIDSLLLLEGSGRPATRTGTALPAVVLPQA
ncbi:MAG: hypothetical protein WKF57_17045 [Nakamurella sp.]